MTTKQEAAGRLAFRHEGPFWNCYIARMDTMEGATLIGSILMRVVEDDEAVRHSFMECMKLAMAHMLKETSGVEVEAWRVTPAPER